jgi:hypothetical protein
MRQSASEEPSMKTFLPATIAAALVLSAPAFAETKKKKPAAPPPVVQVVPPAPVAAPTGAEALSKALAAYAAFQTDVTKLRDQPTPKSAAEVERSLDTVAAHNADALARGWIAYGATVAALSPKFVEEMRKVAAAHGQAKAVTWFSTIPYYAKSLTGGDEATRLVLAASAADADRVDAVGDKMKSTALDLGKSGWGKQRLSLDAGKARYKRLSALAKTPPERALDPAVGARLTGAPAPALDPNGLGGRLFWESAMPTSTAALPGPVATFTPEVQWSTNPAYANALDAMLSLAALRAIGAIDTMSGEEVDRLIDNKATSNCLASAAQSFAQCASAAASPSENLACLGQEALKSRAQCVRSVVGSSSSVAQN